MGDSLKNGWKHPDTIALAQWKKDWADTFGFLARDNAPDSLESIREVSGIMAESAKIRTRQAQEKKERFRRIIGQASIFSP